ncbi:MAG: flippase [Candidatus Firestonebacteria bacterium]
MKNTWWLFITQAITKVLSLLFIVYLGRSLSIGDFGKFNLANAISLIFAVCVDYGFNIYLVREIAKDKTKIGSLLGSIIPFKIILGVLVFASVYFTVVFINYDPVTETVIMLMALYYILFSFSIFFRTIFIAYEMMEYESIFSLIDKILVFVMVIFVVFNKKGVVEIALVYVFVEAIMLISSVYLLLKKFPDIKYVFSKSILITSIKESSYFFLSNILLMLYLYLDSIMLSKMKGEEAVGLYNASYNLVYNLRFLISPLITSLFPSMAFNAQNDKNELLITHKKTGRLLLISGIIVTIICFVLSKQIIILLYGYKFIDSVYAFAILIWAIPFIFVNGFYSYLLTSLNHQKNILLYLTFAVILDVLLNILVIPKYGFIGASFATVISEILYFVLCFRKLIKLGFKQ